MDEKFRGVLDEFLAVAGEHSVSVVLVGSYAAGQVQENSESILLSSQRMKLQPMSSERLWRT